MALPVIMNYGKRLQKIKDLLASCIDDASDEQHPLLCEAKKLVQEAYLMQYD